MAKMKPCKVCSKEVAKSAKACPHCGAKLKMGFFKKVILGWSVGGFIVLIIIIAVASSSGGSGSNPTSGSSSSSSSSTSSEPATLSKEGVSSNVNIAVESVESKDTVGNNQFVNAKAQGIFKVVKLKLTNNQKDAITVDSNSFKLVDDQNREFSYSTDAQIAFMSSLGDQADKESFFLKQINPGLSLEGYVVFDIPKDAKGLALKARGGMMGKEIKLKVE